MEVVVNDSVTREAISRAEERKFLQFVKEDPHFCRYYEGIYILFKTGLRISEFCGLTISDIDFKEHTINIDHQLQKKSKIGYYIQETKTTSGTRKIPMTADVEECFQKIIEKRNPPKAEPMVDGKSGFLYFDKNGSICYSLHWEHYFQHIIQKYNNTYKVQMSVITPHAFNVIYYMGNVKDFYMNDIEGLQLLAERLNNQEDVIAESITRKYAIEYLLSQINKTFIGLGVGGEND